MGPIDGELCTELWGVRGRASCRAWGVEGGVGLEEQVPAFLWAGRAWVTGRTALRGDVPVPHGCSAEPRERRGQLGRGPKAGPVRQLWKAKAQDSAVRSGSDAGCPGGQQTKAGGTRRRPWPGFTGRSFRAAMRGPVQAGPFLLFF